VVEQEVATQGIRMFGRVEPVLTTRQETIVLLRVESTIVKGVHVVVRMRYNEPKFNQ
jgi:hypothetical protein